ncbi:MAG: hypothetical protein RLT05_28415 [Bauldia litoralis]
MNAKPTVNSETSDKKQQRKDDDGASSRDDDTETPDSPIVTEGPKPSKEKK